MADKKVVKDTKEPKEEPQVAEAQAIAKDIVLQFDELGMKPRGRLGKVIESAQRYGGKTEALLPGKGPTVVIAGTRIGPVATGLKPTGPGGEVYVYEDQHFQLPHQVLYNEYTRTQSTNAPWEDPTNFDFPEMSLFIFSFSGVKYHLLMDDRSSFVLSDDFYFRTARGGNLIMINAASMDNHFLGDCSLVNVAVKNTVLNKSHLVIVSGDVGASNGWGPSGPHRPGISKRQEYDNLYLLACSVVDSILSGGRYSNSHITKSTVGGLKPSNPSPVKVTNSYLTQCVINGGKVSVSKLTAEKFVAETEKDILIRGVGGLNGQHWRVPSIHVTNRFAFTQLDYLSRHDRALMMIRTSPTEVYLTTDRWSLPAEKKPLPIDSPRHVIEEQLQELLGEKGKGVLKPFGLIPGPGPGPLGYTPPWERPGFPGYGGHQGTETVKGQILQYLVDQVVSRLKMIVLLDEVEDVAEEMGISSEGESSSFFE